MKRPSQYYSLAAKLWSAHWKESTLLIVLVVLISCILVGLLIPGVVLTIANPMAGGLCLTAVGLVALFVWLLCYYYIPVCYLSMKRGEPLRREGLQINSWRAAGFAAMMLLPTFVSQILQYSQNGDISTGVKLTLSLISLGVSVFAIIWAYAVAAPLPLLANDNREAPVGGLTKRSWNMMDGYKWKLFCVDFLIIYLPILVMVIVLSSMLVHSLVMEGVEAAVTLEDPVDTNLYLRTFSEHIGGTIFICVMMLLVWFVWAPMDYFARALFYDDLLAEQGETTEVIEEIEVIEVK